MARVLVTYGWVRSSYSIVRALGRRGETVYVGYSDAFSMAVHSRYCKAGVKLPDFFDDPRGYVEAVASACRKYAIEVLIPGHEDLYWLARYRELLPRKTKMVHSSLESLEKAMDKATVLEYAKKAGCPVPGTEIFYSLNELDRLAENHDYPAVLKTRTGNSAKGVEICRDKNHLRTKAEEWINRYQLCEKQYPIVQQYLPGRAIGTCHIFRNGAPVAAFSERYIRAKGGGTFGTSTLRCGYEVPEAIDAGNCLLQSKKNG